MGGTHKKNKEKEIKCKWSDLDNESSSFIPNWGAFQMPVDEIERILEVNFF